MEGFFEIEYFKRQYDTIMLLLLSGIGPLPKEIVWMILKDHLYVKPIRISEVCIECYPCLHDVDGVKVMGGRDIYKWFISRKIDIPEHFIGYGKLNLYMFEQESASDESL